MSRLFQKPILKKESIFTDSIKNSTLEMEQKLEIAEKVFAEKCERLEEDFERRKSEKERAIALLDSTLELKRSRRAELEYPILERTKSLEDREALLVEREENVKKRENKVLEREREVDKGTEDIEILAEEVKKVEVRLESKEKLIAGRLAYLEDGERKYNLKIEAFSHEVNMAAARIQERENELSIKELNVQSKEENITKREEKMLEEKLLIESKRQALLAAQKLNGKSNGPRRHIA